jgi:hypothetical protein
MASPSIPIRPAKMSNSASPYAEFPAIKVELTPAEIKALFTTPLDIVGSPGPNRAIKVVSAVGQVATYVSAPYATNLNLQLKTATSNDPQVANAILLGSNGARAISFSPYDSTGASSKQVVADQPLQVTVGVANPLNGDSNIILHVSYTIIDF